MHPILDIIVDAADAVEAGDARRVRQVVNRRVPRSKSALHKPAGSTPAPGSYGSPDPTTTLAVAHRDGWACRYCGTPLIPSALAWALHDAAPHLVHYNYNGRRGDVDRVLYHRWVDIDHVTSPRRDPGGHANDPRNLATACRPCNSLKSTWKPTECGLRQMPPPASGPAWSDVSALYRRLLGLRQADHAHGPACCNHPCRDGFDHAAWSLLALDTEPHNATEIASPDGWLANGHPA